MPLYLQKHIQKKSSQNPEASNLKEQTDFLFNFFLLFLFGKSASYKRQLQNNTL